MKLLLFDIDGTLIRSNRAGRTALKLALEDLFGTAGPIDTYKMSGKTDSRIVTDLLTTAGIDPRKIPPRLPEIYAQMAQRARDVYPARSIEPCPGVPELLDVLRGRGDILLGLLTGNAEPTAPLKLEAGGIDPMHFFIGAYGSDALERNDLPAVAMQRASTLIGDVFDGTNTVIIGDTPADVLCARVSKARAVAVASGWHSAPTLAQYHPDVLLESFLDTPAVVAVLLDEGR